MKPTLKKQIGLWTTTSPERLAVTQNASTYDPKVVVGHVVKRLDR
jgi:hypothetical protein